MYTWLVYLGNDRSLSLVVTLLSIYTANVQHGRTYDLRCIKYLVASTQLEQSVRWRLRGSLSNFYSSCMIESAYFDHYVIWIIKNIHSFLLLLSLKFIYQLAIRLIHCSDLHLFKNYFSLLINSLLDKMIFCWKNNRKFCCDKLVIETFYIIINHLLYWRIICYLIFVFLLLYKINQSLFHLILYHDLHVYTL